MDQALDMELKEEAIGCARGLTQRFPLMARSWIEQSRAQKGEEQIASLRKALSLAPSWAWAANELATALENEERYEEALQVSEENLMRNPMEDTAYGYLSSLLWKMGRCEEAFKRLQEDSWFVWAAARGTTKGWAASLPLREEALQRFPNGRFVPATRALMALNQALDGQIQSTVVLAKEIELQHIGQVYYHGHFHLLNSIIDAAYGREREAEIHYRNALEKFGAREWEPWLNEVVALTQNRLAHSLTWSAGSGKLIRRRWGKYRGQGRSKYYWGIIIGIIAVIRLMGILVKQHS